MSAPAARRDAAPSPLRASILIVGGSARVRNAHAMLLETHGYDVECSEKPETALEICGEKPRSLILFAMDEQSGKIWRVYRLVAANHPEQAIGFALSGTLKLCAVSFGESELIQAQGADDLVSTVEAAARSVTKCKLNNQDKEDYR